MKNIKQKAKVSTVETVGKKSGFGSVIVALKNESPLHLAVLMAAMIGFFYFGIDHLGKFFTTDEVVWLFKRFPQFLRAVDAGQYSQSVEDFSQSGVLQTWLTSGSFNNGGLEGYNILPFEDFLYKWRIPLVLFNGAALVLIYGLLRKLINKDVALITLLLVALFPYLIGISQVFSKDSTLWSTSFCSFLAFLLYIKKGTRVYIFIFGIFLGLGLLSKFPVSIFYYAFFAFLYCEYLFKQVDRVVFLRKSIGLAIGIALSIVVVYLLNPATWSSINTLMAWTLHTMVLMDINLYAGVFIALLYIEMIVFKGRMSEVLRTSFDLNKIMDYSLGGAMFVISSLVLILEVFGAYDGIALLKVNPIVGNTIDNQNFISAFIGGFKTFATQTPTLVFLGTMGMLFIVLRSYIGKPRRPEYRFVTYMLVLLVAYFAGASLSGYSPNTRYQMILLPIYAMVAALFYNYLRDKYKLRWMAVAILMISVIEVGRVAPFYISYSNAFNFNALVQSPKVSWGQGGYEIAKSANTLPDVAGLSVLSDYEGFKEFFKGSTERFDFTVLPSKGFLAQFDYLCLSSNGKSQITRNRAMTPDLVKYYNQPLTDAAWYIGNDDGYVKLVKVQ